MPTERGRIVMLGTSFEVRGGVSAMARVYEEQGLFRRWDAEYLATHCDGSRARKLAKAVRAWFAFAARLALGRVSLVHVHLSSGASYWRKRAFLAPARLLGIPYVIHMHGGDFLAFHRERCGPAVQRAIRSLLGEAEAVIALSREGQAALLEIEPSANVVQIPNPVAIPAWQATLDAGRPTVLFLGVLKAAKGVFELLRAWPRVLESVPDARLVLAGSGAIAEARALAESLGISASVETPGWISGEGKDALLREAWVVTLPSHWEALPMSVLEAMAAGVPVVASRVGGVPMALGEDQAGVLIPPRDEGALAGALTALLRDPVRRKQLGASARARAVAEFSAESIVPRVDALWRRIVPHNAAPCAESSRASGSWT